MSNSEPPPPDYEDLRGLARGLHQLVEAGARALTEDAGPSELALRVTGHLGCELTAIVPVSERFASWEHVNIQRGVDAYLAARQEDPQWFGPSGASHHPHEDLLSMIGTPSRFGRARVISRFPMRFGPGAGLAAARGKPAGPSRGGARTTSRSDK